MTKGINTLRDHFARMPNGPDDRLERLCSIVVDGCPLGDYPTDEERDNEQERRFEELQWAAIALVGCDADLEISELRTLPPGGGRPTADFEATMRRGRVVRLELTSIVFELEKQQCEYFARIAGGARKLLILEDEYRYKGRFIYRAYHPAGMTIGQSEATSGAKELAAFIISNSRLAGVSNDLLPADDPESYPTLYQLGVHVVHVSSEGKTQVMWEPLIEPLDTDGALEVFDGMCRKKGAKIAGYSDDGVFPVWLVFTTESLKQTYLALATVQRLANVDTVDPRPFVRILVGCYTAGVTFIEPYQKPRYTSLSTTP